MSVSKNTTNYNPFNAKSSLRLKSGEEVYFYKLRALENVSVGNISKLPFCIKILLESVLRNCDGQNITEEHVRAILNWDAKAKERVEIPFKPARVLLQDFTGVPAIVDLAAMRDAMKQLGGDPKKINPLVPCDLVIDHSVQVDHFGSMNALALNEKIEFHRNRERYEFLKWGQQAFQNFRVVPPSTGIVHQVNLEYLSQVVFMNHANKTAYPDSCVGTDSHTPMVNGLSVLAWGVGGIEAEAVMLDQPIYMLLPDVVGIKLSGKLPEGATATDLVLRITEMCRKVGVVGKFVECFGPGLASMSIADRATIGNMAPEQGSTISISPVDEQTLKYLRFTGRSEDLIDLVERYTKEQGLFQTPTSPEPEYSSVIELDLDSIEPSVAGPKRPQDLVPLSKLSEDFKNSLTAPISVKGFGLSTADLSKSSKVKIDNRSEHISHGAVVIAAITSCTNTSNPSVMIAAGLVAKKAVERGLKVKPYVKTSLAPGSRVVTDYLNASGLTPYLEQLGFHLVGYGCTTCIGNSGPLPEVVSTAIQSNNLVVSAVLSGNRNFEGRVHPETRASYLASPPLVVAYALAGTTAMNITTEPVGIGSDNQPVYLRDIWPTTSEIIKCIEQSITPQMFEKQYGHVLKGSEAWHNIETTVSELYNWDAKSTYIRRPSFFDGIKSTLNEGQSNIVGARVLGIFGDSVTTDHISPAGRIADDSPAAKYLLENGVERNEWNSYGSRRGNHEVMVRGTFANIRIRNLLTPGIEGNVSKHIPSGKQDSFFDVAQMYMQEATPLIILAGKEYGSGSSRDWAAKGPYLLGVKVVIAESYERIHRSNLVGMGILPLEFLPGESVSKLKLTGEETYDIMLSDSVSPQQHITVHVKTSNGEKSIKAKCRIDTPIEVRYFNDGGILRTVLKRLL
jgi:aconitate hydratase